MSSDGGVTENARALIEGLLARGLGVPCGLRIFAHFNEGVCIQHKLAVFRVPANKSNLIRLHQIHYEPSTLEQIARELNIHAGKTELVIEYAEDGERVSPRWVDFSIVRETC